MRRATDEVEYKKLIEAGFKVKPDLMWNFPYLADYNETVEMTSDMFICRAWSLTLLIESVPKFTACGWFAIAIVDLLLFTLNNSDIVAIGQKYLEGSCTYQDIVDSMAEVDLRPKNSYNPADRQEGTPFPDTLLISD